MRKLLTSLLIIGVMSAMLGQGVVSYMSDIEKSEGNIFTAGTIDLQVDGTDHPPALIQLPDLKPCSESLDVVLPYSNVGTNAGTVTLAISYEEGDNEVLDQDPDFEFAAGPFPGGTPPPRPQWEVSGDDFAKQVFITKAEADTGTDIIDLLPTLVLYAEAVNPAVGGTIDGRVSIFEFSWQEDPDNPGTNIPRVWPLGEVLFPTQSETLTMRFHLDGMVDNEYQADGIVSTLNFEMMQWVPDRSMVLDLQMDTGAGLTAFDSSIYGNDGTLINGPIWVQDPPYKGSALDFDGFDDRCIVPNSPSLEFDEALTLEAWMQPDTVAAGAGRIFSRHWDSPGNHWVLYRDGNKVTFLLYTSGWTVLNSPVLTADTWYHVAGTYDGSDARLYLDGVEVASAPATGAMGQGQVFGPIGVGVWERSDTTSVFDGILDRARIYDRALGPDEIFYSYLVSYSHYHGAP